MQPLAPRELKARRAIMVHKILIGFLAEGTTDHRFLGSVIRRTFENIALEFIDPIEILDVAPIHSFVKGFSEQVADVAQKALNVYGVSVLCVHTDADHHSEEVARENKFKPALKKLESCLDVCKIIVPVIPVHMMEAWVLADSELFKTQIGSDKSDLELGLHRNPESVSDPKMLIDEAIRIAREGLPKRRRAELKRNDLYQPIGSAISLVKLEALSSYRAFCYEVRIAYKSLDVY